MGQVMWVAMDWNGTGHVDSNGLEWDRSCVLIVDS